MTGTYRLMKRANGRHERSAARALLCLLLVGASFLPAAAQNFVNNGQLMNNGLFRVRFGASGLPDTVGGVFEFFGGVQQVEAVTYTTLRLSGTPGSVKTTEGGDFTILQNVVIMPAVTLQVKPGDVMTLEKTFARLTENGTLLGRIRKSQDLLAPTDSSDFGGLGLSIRAAGIPPGATTVVRASGVPVTANGNSSVGRVVSIAPAGGPAIRSSIYFSYASGEMQGQDSTTFDLWRSVDGGTSWRRQHTVRHPASYLLEGRGEFLSGIWTAADATHPLGRTNFEGDPDSASAVGPDSVTARVKKFAPPLVARITDVFGNPVVGTAVSFAVVTRPVGAVGDSLTVVSAVTDTAGLVTTTLKVGDLRGRYEVLSQVVFQPTTSYKFIVEALPGPVALPIVSGNNQTDSIKVVLPINLTVVARDSDGVAVDGVPVRFTIVSVPTGASGQLLSGIVDTTDVLGQARATFRFGSKTGQYLVRATSPEIPNDSATFTLTATHGFAALAWADTVTRRDTIGALTPPMTYTVTDGDTNAVPGRTVNFAITARPAGAVGDTLVALQGTTDSLGAAYATLQLGSKVGRYTVTAVDPGLAGSLRLFQADATPGLPSLITPFVTSTTDTIEALLPQFQVNISDRGANPVPATPVAFLEWSKPAGAVSDSLIVLDNASDPSGNARAQFRLGNKTGFYTVRVSVPSVPGLLIDLPFLALPGVPARLLADAGLGQIKEILQPLDSLFVARLTDRAFNGIANDTLLFTMTSAPVGAFGQSISQSQGTTDSSGRTSTRLTLGSKVGLYRVHAQLLGNASIQTDFDARAVNGMPTAITLVSGNNQSKPILTTLDSAFVVRLTDVGANPVPGATVNFRISRRPVNTTGESLSVASMPTDSLGQAASLLTLGTKVGAYLITANAPTLPADTIFFNATATVGAPAVVARVSGNGQKAQVGDTLSPFVVRVADLGDNPVPAAAVTFRITERPAVATGDTLFVTNALTDTLGQSSTRLVLGSEQGTYVVRASVAGTPDTSFTSTAVFVVADANHDGYQNIGDLTAIIDHLLGRSVLTGYNFRRADIDRNGVVDQRDAILCRDSLLAGVWDPLYNWTTFIPIPKITGVNASTREQAGPDPIEGTVQRTHIGARFFMKNNVPIKGIQATIFLKQPVAVDTADLVFPNARMMQVEVQSVGTTINVVASNWQNAPVAPDTGQPIFRLPVRLSSVADVDSVRFIVSVDQNVAFPATTYITDISNAIPTKWTLYQNYPNPFNGTTTISFDIPEVSGKLPRIAVQIFDLLGRKVVTIEKGFYDAAGSYKVIWNGRNDLGEHVATGVYFYRLLGSDYTATKKMILLK